MGGIIVRSADERWGCRKGDAEMRRGERAKMGDLQGVGFLV